MRKFKRSEIISADLYKQAFKLGENAFSRGVNVLHFDMDNITPLLDGTHATCIQVYKAWISGWTRANLDAPWEE
jgi:hypothetical protein